MPRATQVRAGQEEPSVLDVLGGLDERGLADLLVARPDLLDPPPRGMLDLATRASGPLSLEACRQALDRGCHQVHQALSLLPPAATIGQLAALLGVDDDDPDLVAVLGRLAERALVLRDGERLQLLPGLELHHPAGLGPPVAVALAPQSGPSLANCAQRLGVKAGTTKSATLSAIGEALSDPAAVSRLLAKAPAGAGELARRLAYEGPEGHTAGAVYSGDKTPAGWLANRGFVAPFGWDTVVLVREVGLALRGGRVYPELALRPPELQTEPVDAVAADRGAAERALRLVADITTLFDGWAADAPRQLKGGGLGIQVVRRAAKAIDRSEVDTARVIELAAAAGLVSIDNQSDAALPLPAYDTWLGLDVVRQWSHLAASWLAWDLHVSLAGALDHKMKPIPPLLVRAPEPHAAERRGGMLATMAAARPGTAVPRGNAFAHVAWEVPAVWSGGPASPSTLAAWTLEECELLGLSGLGGLSTWGRLAAVGDRQGAEAALGTHIPAATSQFVVQADLTALAPAELVRPVLAELESMAHLESRGGAALYRFTEATVRRSFEAGQTASDILGFLEAHAAKGVPQALTYLVNDVGRRFGQLRVTATACCLRSDDPSLLAEVVASRPGKKLGLRLLAPTVAAGTADPATVLDALRAAGYAPAEEASDGTLVVSRPPRRRAVPDRRLAALAGRRPGLSAGFGPVGDPFSPPKASTAAADPERSPAAVAARLIRDTDVERGPKRSVPAAKAAKAAKAARPSPAARPATNGDRAAPAPPLPAAVATPPTLSLFDTRSTGSRPPGIARGRDAVAELLERAWVDDWPVRLAYTNKKGRTTQLIVSVVDIGDRDVVVELFTGWDSRVLSLARIDWARVLTEAEEDALS